MTATAAWVDRQELTTKLALAALANLALILASQAAVPLPFTPVPITLQTFAVLVSGVLLGRAVGFAVVFAYVVEGAVGLPVFAEYKGGIATILGPTGGYILGFPLAAYVAGGLWERWRVRSLLPALAVFCIATVAIYVPGLLWLSSFTGFRGVLAAGLLPFIPGALIKIGAASSTRA